MSDAPEGLTEETTPSKNLAARLGLDEGLVAFEAACRLGVEIEEAHEAYLQQLADAGQGNVQHGNRASNLGHPCLRFLTYCRTHSKQRLAVDTNLQSIFQEGKLHEREWNRLAVDLGFHVVESQESFWMADVQISGHSDGCIVRRNDEGGVPVLHDYKTITGNLWPRINAFEDLVKMGYTSRWIDQMMLYMLMKNVWAGMIVLKSKQHGRLKCLPFMLDLDRAEALLQKAEKVNVCVAGWILPEQIPYQESVCGRCGFLHICQPAIQFEGTEKIDDPEVISDIGRLLELKPAKAEHDKLVRNLKDRFHPIGKDTEYEEAMESTAMAGEFLIRIIRKKTAGTPAKPATEPGERVTVKYETLKAEEGANE